MSEKDVFVPRYDPRELLTMDPRVPLRYAMQSLQSLGDFLSGYFEEQLQSEDGSKMIIVRSKNEKKDPKLAQVTR